jgi:hypothetical protein
VLQVLAARMEQEREIQAEMEKVKQERVNSATIATAMPPLRPPPARRARAQTNGQDDADCSLQ